MMDRTLCLAIALTLTLAACGLAQTTKQATTTASTNPAALEALIDQLGAPDWKDRDAAQKRIIEMGEDARTRMQQVAQKSDDPEVRQRAQDILQQIAAADLTRPTLVSLHFKDAPVKEIYQSLFEQANAKLLTWPPQLFEPQMQRQAAKKTATVDMEKVPFWQAINDLVPLTGLAMDQIGRDMVLTDARRRGGINGGNTVVSLNGPFMVVADPGFGAGTYHTFRVYVEPRLRVLAHAPEPELSLVTDAAGNPIPSPLPPQMLAMRRVRQLEEGGGNAFDIRLMMPLPRVGHIKGTERIVVLTREQTIEIPHIDKANNLEKTVEGRRFMLNAMNPEAGDWIITLIAYNTNPPTSGLTQTRMRLVDDGGNDFQSNGMGSSSSDSRVVLNQEFRQGPNAGVPAKLILQFPVATDEMTVPFEFGQGQENPPVGK